MSNFWRAWFRPSAPDPKEAEREVAQLLEQTPVPTLWLFGKTGSGKSSIVRYLTGAEAATIGAGFRPETKSSQRFDFPSSEDPLLTFLDTRGLGEAAYDPQSDIDQFTKATQLMIVTVRVTDHALEGIIAPLRRIRKANPQRPVLLALTCLHLAAESSNIASGPDPFATTNDSTPTSSTKTSSTPTSSVATSSTTDKPTDPTGVSAAEQPPKVPVALQSLIDAKRQQFQGLFDALVPIDLTQPEDGFENPNFGGDRLKQAILETMPHAYRQALLVLNDQMHGKSDRQKRSQWQILASSALAGTAGAVPLPWIDIPVVLALQTHLAMRIAKIYNQEIKPSDWAILSSATGSRIAMRLALTEALKFIPFWGMAAGAASSFAFTYALGMSWDWYFANMRGGNVPDVQRLREIFQEQLKRGRQLWSAK